MNSPGKREAGSGRTRQAKPHSWYCLVLKLPQTKKIMHRLFSKFRAFFQRKADSEEEKEEKKGLLEGIALILSPRRPSLRGVFLLALESKELRKPLPGFVVPSYCSRASPDPYAMPSYAMPSYATCWIPLIHRFILELSFPK